MVWGWEQPSMGWKGLCLHNYINNKSVQFHFIAYSGAQMYVNMHFPCATVFFFMLLHVLYVLCRTVETKIVRREKHNRVKNSTAFYFIFNNLNSNTMALYASLKLYVILIKKLLFFGSCLMNVSWWRETVCGFLLLYDTYIINILHFTSFFPDKNHYHVIKVLSHFHTFSSSTLIWMLIIIFIMWIFNWIYYNFF